MNLRITFRQRQVLEQLARQPLATGDIQDALRLRGRSEHGGFCRTLGGLVMKGMVTRSHDLCTITEIGRAALCPKASP